MVLASVHPNGMSTSSNKKITFVETTTTFPLTSETYTPKVNRDLQYRALDARHEERAPPSTVARPNFEDALRRVSVVLYQHIARCEIRKRNEKKEN